MTGGRIWIADSQSGTDIRISVPLSNAGAAEGAEP